METAKESAAARRWGQRLSLFLLSACLQLGLLWPAGAQNMLNVQPVLSDRIANYTMDVQLDVNRHLLHGTEVLTWINHTSHATQELRFHLYYNAFLNDHSSFLQTSTRRRLNLRDYRAGDWAYCRVEHMELLGGDSSLHIDLTPGITFIQPDDGNPDDRTVIRVPLPEPVAPGDTIRVKIQWESKIPRTFARTGVRGDYYFVAQWFPKIGVFQQDGTWNCHQFIQTEFFADYGVYDVRLTVPTGWVVGASGKELNVIDNGNGTSTHRFLAADVHDFAWTTSPHYRVFTATFSEPKLPEVDIRLLLMPDHLDKKERYFQATRQALKYYGSWFGAYPYEQVTVVDPAYGSGAGGMEYPTLFTGGTRWLAPPETRSPESVTIHECGHQFWYGIVGNNEFEDAWLDEGFNTYSQSRVMDTLGLTRIYYRRYFHGFLPVVFSDIVRRFRYDSGDSFDGLRSPLKRDPMSRPAYQGHPLAYRINAYSKPTLILRTLENYLGWETMQKIMSTYFSRWKFKHPRPADFFQVVNEVSGRDMSWFFQQTYFSSNVFDYAVDQVKVVPVRPPRGYVDKEGTYQFSSGKAPADTAGKDSLLYRATVYLARWGEGIFPVEVKFTFADGEEIQETWNGRERWIRFDYIRPARLVRVEVDPRHVLVLDVNTVNNSWIARAPARKAAWKWASKWMLWLQHTMESFVFFM